MVRLARSSALRMCAGMLWRIGFMMIGSSGAPWRSCH